MEEHDSFRRATEEQNFQDKLSYIEGTVKEIKNTISRLPCKENTEKLIRIDQMLVNGKEQAKTDQSKIDTRLKLNSNHVALSAIIITFLSFVLNIIINVIK